MDTSLTPILGLEFDTLEEVWQYWVGYGGRTGFGVRKHYGNKSKKDKSIIYYKYVCAKKGVKQSDKRDSQYKNPRPETRTRCKANMVVKKVDGRFRVSKLFLDHNHPLEAEETVHMLASQRRLPDVQAYALDAAEDVGIKQKASYDLMAKYAGGKINLGYTKDDIKIYLRSKRQREMVYGEAGCLLRYFQKQQKENPSFYHAYQMDLEEQITNVFWADARMLIDYTCFGEVISFDTTYSTNRDGRPLAVFTGFNHYREVVVFGVALLYDETVDSFKWLFWTFLQAHKEKMPLTIFTDQDAAMARALVEVMPNVKHGLCTFHINKNAMKHLGNLMKAEGSDHFLGKFNWCMYGCEEENVFEESWKALLAKYNVEDNSWLMSIYSLKEKWATCYMKNSMTLGMRSTQLSESINSFIKSSTDPSMNIYKFLKTFEQVLVDKRYNELKSDFNSRQKLPRLLVKSSPMLQQLSQVYTPPIFDLFQQEYDLRDATCIKEKKERKNNEDDVAFVFEYVLTRVDKKGEWRLTYEPSREDGEVSITCSCKKFEHWGILCCHALRVFNDQDVKLLPSKYILKRWTREARCGVVYDSKGNEIEVDPKLECSNRYRQLCPILIKLANDASECPEVFSMVLQLALELIKKVSELLVKHSSNATPNDSGVNDDDVDSQIAGEGTGFKKRERRKVDRSWVYNKIPKTKRACTSKEPTKKSPQCSKKTKKTFEVASSSASVQCGPPLSNTTLPLQYGPPLLNTIAPLQYGHNVSNTLVPIQHHLHVPNTSMSMQYSPLVPSQTPFTTLMMAQLGRDVNSMEALQNSQEFTKNSSLDGHTNTMF